MKRVLAVVAATAIVLSGTSLLLARQDAAAARARANQAPVNLSGTWVPDNARYGTTFTIEQNDKTITMNFGGTPAKILSYNLDGSDSKNEGHTDAVFWNGNQLNVVRDNDNNMRTEYAIINGQLHVTVGGKYIAFNKKS